MSNLSDIILDPHEFIPRLKIKDKNAKLKTFGHVINPEQVRLLNALENNKRVAVVKARQLGSSTLCRSYFFWRAYCAADPLKFAVMSNKLRSATELLDIDKRFLNTLPKPLRRASTIKRDEITFEATGASLGAFSAQSDATDRGYTFNGAHLSEFAFYDKADEVLASLLASANDANVVVESTPNYWGDALHQIAMDAQYNDSWKVIMMPWFTFPDYRKELPKGGLTFYSNEETLKELYNLTDEQIYWRRCKLEEIKSESLFRREYPANLEEAYTLDDQNFFSHEDLDPLEVIDVQNKLRVVLQPYNDRNRYSVGFDPASGVGRDFSVAYVLDKISYSPVAIISSNQLSIKAFSEEVIQIARAYKAPVTFELNNHGAAVKEIFDGFGFSNYVPFTTTQKSKIKLYDMFKSSLQERIIENIDSITFSEMRNLVIDDKGRAPHHPEGNNYHDDRCIAYALALRGLQSVQTPKTDWDRMIVKKRRPSKHRPITTAHPLKSSRRFR